MGERLDGISWVIIGSQTRPTVMPKIEWVNEIVLAAEKAGIPIFIKNNMLPLIKAHAIDKREDWTGVLRQEMPERG